MSVVLLEPDLIIPVPEEPESRLLPVINGSKQSPGVAGAEVGGRETAPSGPEIALISSTSRTQARTLRTRSDL